jgi:hypothetical protein
MAVLDFTFANGALSVTGGGRTDNFYSSDFRAKTVGDHVYIYPINQDDNNKYVQRDWDYYFGDITFENVSYLSAEEFVIAFNAIAGQSIGFNTKYPEILFSQHIELDTSVDEQVVPVWCITGHNAGYVILTAPSTNTGNIYVGESDVSNDSYALEPDRSITLELSDLSQIWVRAETPNDHINIIGACKI